MSKDKCSNCGCGTNRKMFRTGDKQRPGGDVDVCPGCGGQCSCPKPKDQPEDQPEDQE